MSDNKNGEMLERVVGGSWTRLLIVLMIGLSGGGGGGVWLANAQIRTDEEIREIAARQVEAERRVTKVELDHIKEAVREVKGDVKEILRRLPMPPAPKTGG